MPKKPKEITIRSSAAEYLTYIAATGDNKQSFEMRYEDENIWLTQKMMALLYDAGTPTINEHIAKIYADTELAESATIRNFRIVQTEGNRQVEHEIMHYITDKTLFSMVYASMLRISLRISFTSMLSISPCRGTETFFRL
jgi:hypothetical protein